MSKTIIIDPGHGGFDAGAMFEDRKEKDDTLRLALAIGEELEKDGYRIVYTRTDDRYDSPYDKAQFANNSDGDLFLSIHRNFAAETDLYKGVQALVYGTNPTATKIATAVNEELEKVGFRNINVEERKELVVLRRTEMPAVLLEVGFINSNYDNQLFDERFSQIVDAIVDGVEEAFPSGNHTSATSVNTSTTNTTSTNSTTANSPSTNTSTADNNTWEMPDTSTYKDDSFSQRLQEAMQQSMSDFGVSPQSPPPQSSSPSVDTSNMMYYVQVGLFRYPENAVYLMEQLKQQNYDAIWQQVGGLIAVWVGPCKTLDEAVVLQRKLQADGYETLIVTDQISKK